MNETAQRELTYGEKAVGINFNVTNDTKVQEIKELYAKIIDICNNEISKLPIGQNEQVRLYKVAITEAQTAQMWAVKAITYKF